MKSRCVMVVIAGLLALGLGGCGDETAGGSARRNLTLDGQAWYPDSTPAPGILARLRPRAYLQAKTGLPVNGPEARTDSAGRFTLTGLDTGHYLLEFQAGEESGAAIPLALDGSQATSLVEGTLRPTCALEGNLRDTQGRPVAHAEIAVFGMELRTLSDSTGYFRFDALPPDTLSFRVIPEDVTLAEMDIENVGLPEAGSKTLDTLTLRAR
jgi:hypothetical protein